MVYMMTSLWYLMQAPLPRSCLIGKVVDANANAFVRVTMVKDTLPNLDTTLHIPYANANLV